MSSAFDWKSGPSQIIKPLQRKSRAKPANNAARTDRVLRDRFSGSYSKAVASARGGD